MGWNTTKLIAVGSFAVLIAVLEIGGGVIAAVTGIPGTSGVIDSFVEEILIVVALFTVNQFGTATITRTILGVLVLPLPVIGIPGFLPKVGIAAIVGIVADLLYFSLKRRKKLASFIVGGASEVCYLFTMIGIGRQFRMPGIEKMVYLMFSPLGVVGAVLVGGFSGYFGYVFYNKIKDSTVVRRIQGN
jgi:hypothetical protein